jgi:exonuclease SbcC
MIPIRLKISGIYSYLKEQDIDFSMLTSAHLFGIFGAVGSGKSALLEAIVFALYGESERLNSRELRAYNMMNLKSNEAFIQFDFLAPGNKGLFRAIAKGKRHSRNKEDVKFDRALYKIENNQPIPVETSAIQSIIGISYENFRRTIIIPQGKFQEFLQLGVKDRTEMVKELFNLHRFDLSFKTGRLQKKNDEALNICGGRLQQLGEISREDIDRINQSIKDLAVELESLELKLRNMEIEEVEIRKTRDILISLNQYHQKLQELQARKGDILEVEKRLADYDDCVSQFKSDLGLFDSRKTQIREEEGRLEKINADLTLANTRLSQAEKQHEEARIHFDKREDLLKESLELEICAGINQRTKKAAGLAERIAKGEKQIADTVANRDSLKEQSALMLQTRDTLRKQLPDLERVKSAENWFSTLRLLNERYDAQLAIMENTRKAVERIENEIQAIIKKANLNAGDSKPEIAVICNLLEAKLTSTEEELKNVQSANLQLEVQLQLQSFASELKEGDPCPLCGSTEHPGIRAHEDIGAQYEKSIHQKKELELKTNELRSLLTKSKLLGEEVSRVKQEAVQAHAGIEEARQMLAKHRLSNPYPELTEEKIKEDWSVYSKIQQESALIEQRISEISSTLEKEEENLKKFNDLLGDIRIEFEKTRQDADTLKSQLKLVDYNHQASISEEALLENSAGLKLQYEKAGEQFQQAETALKEALSLQKSLAGSRQNTEESLAGIRLSSEELKKQLEVRFLSSRFKDETTVRSILQTEIDRTKEQLEIRRFYDEWSGVTAAIQQLQAQVKDKTYDEAIHQQLLQDIQELKSLTDKKKEEKGALDGQMLKMNKDLAESLQLKAEFRKLEIRRDNLKTLSDLFRGQSFVNYVSTIYLQNLVASANERFYRLTRQQLKLELDEENNFRIRDFLNDGQWRSVKTLSGGQTFQASLCLALALADNIQQLNEGGQNFFFLDEGFGTLDRESLELVFDTLKSLRKENRVVGVISHVEDLQQEINAWLKITRDEENGSQVQPSWQLE